MAELIYDFCEEVERENWATIDSIYIMDQKLTMIFRM